MLVVEAQRTQLEFSADVRAALAKYCEVYDYASLLALCLPMVGVLSVAQPPLIQRVAERHLEAFKAPLSEPTVVELRQEFLLIMKNLPRVRDYETASKLKQACIRWKDRMEEFGRQIREDLEGRIRQAKMRAEHPALGMPDLGDPQWAKWYLDHMKPFWDLTYEVGRIPVVSLGFAKKYSPGTTEEHLWQKYEVGIPKWEGRVRHKSRAAWKYLKDLVQWTSKVSYLGGGQVPIELITTEEEIVNLEGFKLLFRGFPDSGYQDKLKPFREALRRYRKSAAQRLPLMLRWQLPMEVDWTWGGSAQGGAAGRYEQTKILITPWGLTSDVDRVVKTMAHEMGHHLYQKYLSGDAKTFWDKAVSGDYKDLDLRDALKTMESLGATHVVDEKLQADPILYIQLGTLLESPTYKYMDLWSQEAIREYLAKPDSLPVVRVPTSPITGYSGKNNEEAFCEAVGNLVAYGPNFLPDKVLGWLKLALGPQVKVGSTRQASYFNVGDEILFGKWKNKRGRIVSMGKGPNGIPFIEVEPVPKGRKKNKIIGLFKIWHADPAKRVASRWATEWTPERVHNLADSLGVLWDDAPDFMRLSEQVTGKAHLDDMTPTELQEVGWALTRVATCVPDAKRVIRDHLRGLSRCERRDVEQVDDVLDVALDAWHEAAGESYNRALQEMGLLDEDIKEGLVDRIAARYQKKKEVPKANGKGTTTVYEYSDRQVQNRNRDKAERVEKLRKSITDLRSQVKKDLGSKDLKESLVALAVGLMDATYERVGNEDSADEGHFGVTGWLKKHIKFSKGKATFRYVGKSGVEQEKVVEDKRLVEALHKCCEGKSPEDSLLSADDVKVTATDVNKYLKPFGITAKDLRGFHANLEVMERLKAIRSKGPKLPEDKKEREELLLEEFEQAVEEAAEAVGHEPSTLRKQYLVPKLEDTYRKDGTVPEKMKLGSESGVVEKSQKKADHREVTQYKNLRAYWEYNSYAERYYGVHDTDSDAKLDFGQIRFDKKSFTWTASVYPDWPESDRRRVKLTSFSAKDDREGVKRSLMVLYEYRQNHPEVRIATWDYTPWSLSRMATKTDGEKEDEEAERLVRPSPKKKPPRDDSKREKMHLEDGEDEDGDLSLNYKDVGG